MDDPNIFEITKIERVIMRQRISAARLFSRDREKKLILTGLLEVYFIQGGTCQDRVAMAMEIEPKNENIGGGYNYYHSDTSNEEETMTHKGDFHMPTSVRFSYAEIKSWLLSNEGSNVKIFYINLDQSATLQCSQ